MIAPSLAYALVSKPGRIAAVDDSRALLERLSKDSSVANDRELKHAVEFATKSTQLERKIAVDNLAEAIRRGSQAGVAFPPLPATASDWPAWRRAAETAIQPHVDESGALALELGAHYFDLLHSWCRAERIAYLRAARPDHPVLVEEAAKRVTEVASARQEFGSAVATSGRPLLQVRHSSNEEMETYAPRADALRVSGWPSAFAGITDWIRTVEAGMDWLGEDLDVGLDPTPHAPPTAEEDQLVAAIAANPCDDALRTRFADLAEQRGDVRAQLVREQLSEAARAEGTARRASQQIDSHPEWSAPLIALGARELRYTRGFVSEVTIDLDTLVANADKLFALAPITVLRVTGGLAGRGAELASVQQLERLKRLEITKQGLTDKDLRALLDSSCLRRLRHLGLSQNVITDAGVEALAAATADLPALHSVNLSLNHAARPAEYQPYGHGDETIWRPTARGEELEAKYGRIRWLHEDDRAST